MPGKIKIMASPVLTLSKRAALPCLAAQLLVMLAYFSFSSYYRNTPHSHMSSVPTHSMDAVDTIVTLNGTSIQIEHPEDIEIKFPDAPIDSGNKGISVAVGLGLTTRAKGDQLTDIGKHIFFSALMPSFCKTASKGYTYNFYISFDFNDPMLSKSDQLERFQKVFTQIRNGPCKELTVLGLHFVKCSHTHKPAWAQNDAMMSAYMDHNDYFYRINDDTLMISKGWTEVFIRILSEYDPPNVGVVGPAHSGGNTAILTYDFVHYTHVDIFGLYYPRDFFDWHGDRWITDVYKPGRITKVPHVKLKHTMSKGTRYAVHRLNNDKVKAVIDRGKAVLKRYIEGKESNVSQDKGKLIAMSLVGDNQAELYGAIRNVLLQPIHFPAWSVRIYLELPSNSTSKQQQSSSIPNNIANKLKQLPVQLVHVNTQKLKLDSSLWPVLAVDDPSVDYLLVRKASSRLSDRDAAVVNEWLASKKVVHVIKDHPKHSSKIIPGLWGIDTKKFKGMMKGDLTPLVHKTQNESSFLNDILWPLVSNDILCHDSISCSNKTQPFPRMRLDHEYLGQEFGPYGQFAAEKFDDKAGCA